MSSETSETASLTSMSPSEVFHAYCQDEFERRRNSGQSFDEEAYKESMDMALLKLKILEEEGLA